MEFSMDYCFDDQDVPCTSSYGGCYPSSTTSYAPSTASYASSTTSSAESTMSSAPSTTGSIQDPFTPPSGRSTPGLLPTMMGHDNVGCGTMEIGVTPPGSLFGTNFSPNESEPTQYMEFDFNTYPQQPLISPPLEFVQPAYSTESFNPYGVMQPWQWAENGPSMFTEGTLPAAALTLNEATSRLSYLSVEEKTALHQAQGRARRARRGKNPVVMVQRGSVSKSRTIPAVLCTTGTHKCLHPDCAHKSPFKRQEHLKRHTKTVHGDQNLVIVVCQFCMGRFNRDDNYRTHLYLHTQQGGRTKYFPEAQPVYDEVMRNTKQRRPSQKVAEPAERPSGSRRSTGRRGNNV